MSSIILLRNEDTGVYENDRYHLNQDGYIVDDFTGDVVVNKSTLEDNYPWEDWEAILAGREEGGGWILIRNEDTIPYQIGQQSRGYDCDEDFVRIPDRSGIFPTITAGLFLLNLYLSKAAIKVLHSERQEIQERLHKANLELDLIPREGETELEYLNRKREEARAKSERLYQNTSKIMAM